jgi:hypothetical protein
MDQSTWIRRAKALVAELEGPTLALFEQLGGRALAEASEAAVGVVYQRAVQRVMEQLFQRMAELRGLRPPTQPRLLLDPLAARVHADDPPSILGVIHENLLGRLPRLTRGRWVLASSHKRRSGGVFFTPPGLVEHLVGQALDPHLARCRSPEALLRLRAVDPSMGAGFFLLAALDRLSTALLDRDPSLSPSRARRLVAIHCLHGLDVDGEAVALGRRLLWLSIGDPELSVEACAPGLRVGDGLLGPPIEPGGPCLAKWAAQRAIPPEFCFSWTEAFPEVFAAGGFDAVLGNPPWGRIRPEIKSFHLHHDAQVSHLQGARLRQHVQRLDARVSTAWEEHRARWLAYGRRLRDCGSYHAQRVEIDGKTTRGDADAYKYFLERSFHLLRDGGRLAMVIPAAFQQSEGATGLRQLYFERGACEQLLSFENRGRHFPIHGMFRYSLFVWCRGGEPGLGMVQPGLTELGQLRGLERRQPPRMSLAWLRQVSDRRLTVPAVRTRGEQDLYERLTAHPRLGQASASWNVSFVRELDMTKDHHRFRSARELAEAGFEREGSAWRHPQRGLARPLYEGRMVHQHDHAAKGYLGGSARRARWEPLPWTHKRIQPHYWVVIDELDDAGASVRAPRAGFCDITGHANERTALTALIPAGHPCGNKVPTLRFDQDDPRLPLLWVSMANSLVVGWVLRRLLETTLNYFHWAQVPFPRLDPDGPEGAALWTAAWRLARAAPGHERIAGLEASPPATDPQERARLRAEIDAIVAQTYGLGPAEMAMILDDFPLLDRNQPPLEGEPRSTITRDRALLALHEGLGLDAQATRSLRDRALRATRLGAIAYLPSEQVSAMQT